MTNINLTQLSHELQTNAEKIPSHSASGFDASKIKIVLGAKARFLVFLQENQVAHIRKEIQVLKAKVASLKEHLAFNHTNLRTAVENLLIEVENAQLFLRKNGTTEMKLVMLTFSPFFFFFLHRV